LNGLRKEISKEEGKLKKVVNFTSDKGSVFDISTTFFALVANLLACFNLTMIGFYEALQLLDR